MTNRNLLALIFLVCLWLTCEAKRKDGQTAPIYQIQEVNNLFSNFKTKYDKIYASPEEETDKLEKFKGNLEKYNEANRKFNNDKSNNYLEINRFSDWTDEEVSVFNGSADMMKNYDSI